MQTLIVLFSIAIRHILARRRQSIVSLLGIVLGVAFFLAISGLMRGSERDFIHRLVDNTPHITISDEYRNPRLQPVERLYPDAAVELRGVKPLSENRGIRGHGSILDYLRTQPGIQASASLVGQAIISFAGRDVSISLDGVVPQELDSVSTISEYVREGSIDALSVNPDGVIIGAELARRLALGLGDNISVASPAGLVKTMKIVGIFRTGQSDYDEKNVFANIGRVQSLMGRINRVNNIVIKIPDPYKAHEFAAVLERRVSYKATSWQESFEDLMNTLHIRNVIMYSVVSALLIVASFGIYNIISTIVMEKHRDIAILKSMGFRPRDIRLVFTIQGIILGAGGSVLGIALGCVFMAGLMRIEFTPPGMSEPIHMPISWEWGQFAVAALFALFSSVLAAWLPARKGAAVPPVDILRGAA